MPYVEFLPYSHCSHLNLLTIIGRFRCVQIFLDNKPKSCCLATGIAYLVGRSAPPKEHKNTMSLFYSVERTVATERATERQTNPNLPVW